MPNFPYTKIPLDTFNNMGLNAGIMTTSFDPANPPSEDELMKTLIGATTGGIEVDITPDYTDLGEDIDNCPKNTLELKQLNGWTIIVSTTFVTMSKDSTVLQLGPASVVDEATGQIKLRNYVQDSDFKDVWWIGDYNQGNGFIAICIKNALSTGGMKLKSTDQGKLTNDCELTAHYSIKDQDTVPVDIYILGESGSTDTATASVKPTGDNTDSTTNGTEVETEG